jgi:hypothetical protein
MSMERCSICERDVDTDFDVEGNYTQDGFVCGRCYDDGTWVDGMDLGDK